MRRNLRTVRAYLLKEDFQSLWEYVSPYWAGRFLASSPRKRGPVVHPHDAFALDPMKQVVRMVRPHRELILNWFRARGQLSNAIVEGFNGKAGVTTKKAFGHRTCEVLEIALYHTLGDLPEPELTHRFC